MIHLAISLVETIVVISSPSIGLATGVYSISICRTTYGVILVLGFAVFLVDFELADVELLVLLVELPRYEVEV